MGRHNLCDSLLRSPLFQRRKNGWGRGWGRRHIGRRMQCTTARITLRCERIIALSEYDLFFQLAYGGSDILLLRCRSNQADIRGGPVGKTSSPISHCPRLSLSRRPTSTRAQNRSTMSPSKLPRGSHLRSKLEER